MSENPEKPKDHAGSIPSDSFPEHLEHKSEVPSPPPANKYGDPRHAEPKFSYFDGQFIGIFFVSSFPLSFENQEKIFQRNVR